MAKQGYLGECFGGPLDGLTIAAVGAFWWVPGEILKLTRPGERIVVNEYIDDEHRDWDRHEYEWRPRKKQWGYAGRRGKGAEKP